MQKVTLKTIADICGVSMVTVSKAITGKSDISKSTREKILRIAKDLNYVPNQGARSLRSGKNNRFAIIYDDFYNPYYQQLIELYYQHLLRKDYSLEFVYIKRSDENDAKILNSFPVNVDGVISLVLLNKGFVDYFFSKGIPLVQLGINAQSNRVDSFSFDDFEGGRMISEYLLKKGIRSLGYVGCNEQHTPSLHRLEGVKKSLMVAGIEMCDDNILFLEENNTPVSEAVDLFLHNDVEGIICFNDVSAFMAKRHLLNIEREDIIVTGFDNIGHLVHYPFKIPSVYGDIEKIVEESLAALFDRINGSKRKVQLKIFPVHLSE